MNHPHENYGTSFTSAMDYWFFLFKNRPPFRIDETSIAALGDVRHWDLLINDLEGIIDENGHANDSSHWERLRLGLIKVAGLQQTCEENREDNKDSFDTYAELYDEVIGNPCLDHFMKKYIRHAFERSGKNLSKSTLLSIGCGTGITEEHILKNYPIPHESLLGIDNSESMVDVASRRIRATVADFLETPLDGQWDFTTCGLNVFQYFPAERLEEAIKKASRLTKSNGWFLGDFISPDHIRWYPNVIRSENVVSLRQPRLVEKNFHIFQQSEIINVNRLRGDFRVTYEGKHLRCLTSVQRMKRLFEKHFRRVSLLDAVSLEQLPENAETTPSTRYVILASPE